MYGPGGWSSSLRYFVVRSENERPRAAWKRDGAGLVGNWKGRAEILKEHIRARQSASSFTRAKNLATRIDHDHRFGRLLQNQARELLLLDDRLVPAGFC